MEKNLPFRCSDKTLGCLSFNFWISQLQEWKLQHHGPQIGRPILRKSFLHLRPHFCSHNNLIAYFCSHTLIVWYIINFFVQFHCHYHFCHILWWIQLRVEFPVYNMLHISQKNVISPPLLLTWHCWLWSLCNSKKFMLFLKSQSQFDFIAGYQDSHKRNTERKLFVASYFTYLRVFSAFDRWIIVHVWPRLG